MVYIVMVYIVMVYMVMAKLGRRYDEQDDSRNYIGQNYTGTMNKTIAITTYTT